MRDAKKANKRFKQIPDDEVRIALKWLKDEVHLTDYMKYYGKRSWGSATYSKIACGLRQAYRERRLKITDKKFLNPPTINNLKENK